MTNTITKTQMNKMIKAEGLQFVRFASGVTFCGLSYEVYRLNGKAYRIFAVHDKERTKVEYVDIGKEEYSLLDFDFYNELVRYHAVGDLFRD